MGAEGSGNIGDSQMHNKLLPYLLDENNMATVVDTTRKGLGAGTPGPAAIQADSEQVALVLDASDEFYWKILIAAMPDFDPAGDILAQPIIGSSGGASDTGLSLTVAIKGLAAGEAMSDAKSSPDGSYTFPDQVVLGADKIQSITPVGLSVAGMFAADLELLVALTATSLGDASANEVELHGLILWYQRQMSHSSGARQFTT